MDTLSNPQKRQHLRPSVAFALKWPVQVKLLHNSNSGGDTLIPNNTGSSSNVSITNGTHNGTQDQNTRNETLKEKVRGFKSNFSALINQRTTSEYLNKVIREHTYI